MCLLDMLNFKNCMAKLFPTIRFCKMIHLNGFVEFVEVAISCSVVQKMCNSPLNVSIQQIRSVCDARFPYVQNAVGTLKKASNRPSLLPMTTTSLTRMLLLWKNRLLGWKRRLHVLFSQASYLITCKNKRTFLAVEKAIVI